MAEHSMLIKREPMAMPVGTRQTFPIRTNIWIPLQQADPDLSKRHGVHQRPEKKIWVAEYNDLPGAWSLYSQYEKFTA